MQPNRVIVKAICIVILIILLNMVEAIDADVNELLDQYHLRKVSNGQLLDDMNRRRERGLAIGQAHLYTKNGLVDTCPATYDQESALIDGDCYVLGPGENFTSGAPAGAVAYSPVCGIFGLFDFYSETICENAAGTATEFCVASADGGGHTAYACCGDNCFTPLK